MKMSRVVRAFCCFLLLTMLFSCYEAVDGCLDPDATNYDVDADNECEDCCTLPTFAILMSYLVDGESYIQGNSFRVSQEGLIMEDFHFFISDIKLIDPEGNEINYEDDFLIYDNNRSGESIKDDFKYFASNQFRGTLEGLRYSGIIEEISFNIGLTERINNYNKDSLEVNTELSRAPDSIYVSVDEGYEFYAFQIRDTMNSNVNLRVPAAYPLVGVSINLEGEEVRRGFNDDVNLFIDFGVLFDGINLTTMSEEEILLQIKNNFPFAFGKR
jgi:hypothetical protein